MPHDPVTTTSQLTTLPKKSDSALRKPPATTPGVQAMVVTCAAVAKLSATARTRYADVFNRLGR